MSAVDDLKKEANDWLKEVRRGNPGPVKRLRLAHPHAPAAPTLRDIQYALAREQGHENWKALAAAVARSSEGGMGTRESQPEAIARFLDFACWDGAQHGRGTYEMRETAAVRLLEQNRSIARHDLYTSVVTGDLEEVRRILNARPELVNRKGGNRHWEPLLYLCYGRVNVPAVTEHSAAIARLLLDRGANPNPYFMAGHALYSTLVGVAGEGEQDASPHVQRDALYALLLERGAELYDHQIVYNTHFRGDMSWWLELTYAEALRAGRKSDWDDPEWPMFDMGWYGSGARFLLQTAIDKNDVRLARWLLEHGANPNAAPARLRRSPTRSLYEEAAVRGRKQIAELLVRHGATRSTVVLSDEEAFIDACLRGDRQAATTLVSTHPEYLRSPRALFAAAEQNSVDAVALLLDLGVPIDIADEHHQQALHVAAASNSLEAAQFLIDHGAPVDPRETRWNAIPLGYATYHGHGAMRRLLSGASCDVWQLAYLGRVDRLEAVLTTEPERAREITENGTTPLWWLPNDDALAVAVADVLIGHGADPSIPSKSGKTAGDYARERGLVGAAQRMVMGKRE